MMEKFCTKCSKKYSGEADRCPVDGTRLIALEDTNLIGRVVDDRYEIISEIGRGGMGVVYVAEQAMIGRRVALKVLRNKMVQNEASVKRFLTEAKTIASLRSPNTITLHDFGVTEEGLPYFTMELLEGISLSDLLDQQGPLHFMTAAEVVFQVLNSLEEAHDNGILHRDLKPDNIFLSKRKARTHVTVLDFGIAKLLGDDTVETITQAGAICGTPHYLSPEQVMGNKPTTASDMYSLGILFYEMMTDEPPFLADSPMKLMLKHIHDTAAPLSTHETVVPIPVEIQRFMDQALAKDPARRFSNVSDFREALVAALEAASVESDLESMTNPVPGASSGGRKRRSSIIIGIDGESEDTIVDGKDLGDLDAGGRGQAQLDDLLDLKTLSRIPSETQMKAPAPTPASSEFLRVDKPWRNTSKTRISSPVARQSEEINELPSRQMTKNTPPGAGPRSHRRSSETKIETPWAGNSSRDSKPSQSSITNDRVVALDNDLLHKRTITSMDLEVIKNRMVQLQPAQKKAGNPWIARVAVAAALAAVAAGGVFLVKPMLGDSAKTAEESLSVEGGESLTVLPTPAPTTTEAVITTAQIDPSQLGAAESQVEGAPMKLSGGETRPLERRTIEMSEKERVVEPGAEQPGTPEVPGKTDASLAGVEAGKVEPRELGAPSSVLPVPAEPLKTGDPVAGAEPVVTSAEQGTTGDSGNNANQASSDGKKDEVEDGTGSSKDNQAAVTAESKESEKKTRKHRDRKTDPDSKERKDKEKSGGGLGFRKVSVGNPGDKDQIGFRPVSSKDK